MNASTPKDSRQQAPWEFLKDFTEPVSSVAVRISKQDGYRPKYSMKIGRIIKRNGQPLFVPYMPMYVDVDLGRVTVHPVHVIVQTLTDAAVEYIHSLAQLHEDKLIAEKISKEEKDANRNKPPTRQTGKTQKDREKRTV